jgi:hypothetical protein
VQEIKKRKKQCRRLFRRAQNSAHPAPDRQLTPGRAELESGMVNMDFSHSARMEIALCKLTTASKDVGPVTLKSVSVAVMAM